MRKDAIAQATGPYRWAWTGKAPNGANSPAALWPAGAYDVAVVLTDAAANSKTVDKRITLSRDHVRWNKRQTVTRRGRDLSLVATDKNARISVARSPFAGGVRLSSGRGFAGVVYSFPVKRRSGQVLDVVQFKVVGRSPNRHKAVIAMWNKTLGGPRQLANYDAAKLVGPRLRTWTTAGPGFEHIGQRRALGTVMTWRGLGRAGSSVFDIKKVIFTYRVGTIVKASGAGVSASRLANAIESAQRPRKRTAIDFGAERNLPAPQRLPEPTTEQEAATSDASTTEPPAADTTVSEEDQAGG